MYYIFTTEKEAKAYDSDVSEALKYPQGDNWANPRKHPKLSKWAILAHSKVKIEGKTPEKLTDEWITN